LRPTASSPRRRAATSGSRSSARTPPTRSATSLLRPRRLSSR
jgi:hypothetical protein